MLLISLSFVVALLERLAENDTEDDDDDEDDEITSGTARFEILTDS